MPQITIEYQKPSEESWIDAFDSARELLEVEKAKYPHITFSHDPSWVQGAATLTATLPGKGGLLVPVEEPVEVVEEVEHLGTCLAKKKDGEECGRDLPCRYHEPISALVNWATK